MREYICAAGGIVGGAIAYLFGGWSAAIVVLLICMAIDYLTGLIVAGVFHASPKSANGGLESKAGWKGLLRKFVTLLIVVIANMIDKLLDLTYIRDAVVIAFCLNEIISIVENAGLMGIPIPRVIMKGIDLLQEKAGDKEETEENEREQLHSRNYSCGNSECVFKYCPYPEEDRIRLCSDYIEAEE